MLNVLFTDLRKPREKFLPIISSNSSLARIFLQELEALSLISRSDDQTEENKRHQQESGEVSGRLSESTEGDPHVKRWRCHVPSKHKVLHIFRCQIKHKDRDEHRSEGDDDPDPNFVFERQENFLKAGVGLARRDHDGRVYRKSF